MESQLEQLNNENGELKVSVESLDTKVKQLEQMNQYLVEENRQLKETLIGLTQFDQPIQSIPYTDAQVQTPRTPSTDESADVDQFLSSVTSDSEEISVPPSPPTTINMLNEDPVFGEDSLLNDSPFAWHEPNMFNMVTLFSLFLCFGLFFPFHGIGNTTYPNTIPEYRPETSFISKFDNRLGRSLLDNAGSGDQPVTADLFNSSFTCPVPALSMEDVFLDEMKVSASESPTDSLYYQKTTNSGSYQPRDSRWNRNIYPANDSYEEVPHSSFVGISIPSTRVLVDY